MSFRHSERFPVLAAFVALTCYGLGGLAGWAVGELIGAPVALHAACLISGYVCGYLLGRTVLRRLFAGSPVRVSRSPSREAA